LIDSPCAIVYLEKSAGTIHFSKTLILGDINHANQRLYLLRIPAICVLATVLIGGAGTAYAADTDHDGLSNKLERALRTNVRKADTDKDGLSDGVEVHIAGTNPRRKDSDGDGIRDRSELFSGTNPLNIDLDNDGRPDGSDDDSIVDEFEVRGVVNQITDICLLHLSSSVALINACTAELDEGIVSLASLIGREVKAEGSIVNRTLIARKIEVDNDAQCGGDDS
jgi:thrombospondin type 3 repeat protein